MQLTAADELNLTVPLIDQGVDSLSAVTVGSWFSKNLSVDIPLLKILGGASVIDLVDEAAFRLTPEAIPLAHSTSSEEASQAAADVQLSASKSTLSASNEPTFSDDYDSVPTPPSPASREEEGFEREAPLSAMQVYSWKQQQLPLDPRTSNSTIGMYMHGPPNLNHLGWAFNQAL